MEVVADAPDGPRTPFRDRDLTVESLRERLRQRKVIQWALAYAAGAWALLQVVDLVGGQFGWPPDVLRSITAVVAVGFFAALVVAWYHGERGAQRVSGVELLMLSALLVIAGGVVAIVGGRMDAGAAETRAGEPDSGAGGHEAVASPEPASLAVLPFVNMSADSEQEYFSDGLTEELLNALARVPGLRVPARTSSFAFKGLNVPVDSIARRLNVAHVLEGSVRREGDRLRITAQLVDARSDTHVWSETYDRRLQDVFAIQEEIAGAIVREMQARLGGAGTGATAAARSTDPETYDLYLRGLHFWNRRGAESLARAIAYFEDAARRDPAHAPAHAGLALAHALLPTYADSTVRPALGRVEAAAARALAIDSSMVDAYAALGFAYMDNGKWDQAREAYRAGLERGPGNPTVLHWYSALVGLTESPERGLAMVEEAMALDPLSPGLLFNLGDQLGFTGRPREAVATFRRALEIQPSYGLAHRGLAVTLLQDGKPAEAASAAERLLALPGERTAFELAGAGYVFARTGDAQRARDILHALEERERSRNTSSVAHATVLAGLGEHDRAFERLRSAVADWDFHMVWLRRLLQGYEFEELRADARFADVRRGVGLR